MKRKRMSYDKWTCITKRDVHVRRVQTDVLNGHVGLMRILEVTRPQRWQIHGVPTTICDAGMAWLTVLPLHDHYFMTAMMDAQGEVVLWYVDMIAGQGVDDDGMPYYDDLYLDIVVYQDGEIVVADRGELDDALTKGAITQAQHDLALATARRLMDGMLGDMKRLQQFTAACLALTAPDRP